MPAFVYSIICLFRRHKWDDKSEKFGDGPRVVYCTRCAAEKVIEPPEATYMGSRYKKVG